MAISVEMIRELREQSGAGIMDCRNILLAAEGDMGRALQILKEKGLLKAKKKSERATSQGLVEGYVHVGGRIGAMVELNCESDFVARTDEFRELAHCLAMQVAAMSPQFIAEEDIPEEADDVDAKAACLLLQSYIKNPAMTVRDVIVEAIVRVGENIKIGKFARFELGD